MSTVTGPDAGGGSPRPVMSAGAGEPGRGDGEGQAGSDGNSHRGRKTRAGVFLAAAAGVLVVAAGRAGLVDPDMVKAGSAVVDVGINRTDAGLVGDVDPGAAEVAAFMTPVPGGVGPMTIALLLRNAVRCASYRRGNLPFPTL